MSLPRKRGYSARNVTVWETTRGLTLEMTNGNDYSGAIESAKQLKKLIGKVYRFYAGPKIPKDPQAVIDFARNLKKQEALKDEAELAREYIKKTLKERNQKERAARRAKIKRLFGKK